MLLRTEDIGLNIHFCSLIAVWDTKQFFFFTFLSFKFSIYKMKKTNKQTNKKQKKHNKTKSNSLSRNLATKRNFLKVCLLPFLYKPNFMIAR